MPELPEVEIISRALHQNLSGKTFSGMTFYRDDIREPLDKEKIRSVLMDQKILGIRRRSKYCLVETQKGFLAFHLGMTGQLILSKHDKPQIKHTHAVFHFHGQQSLHFVDPRRFGRILALQKHELDEHPFFANLGVEPLVHECLGEHLWTQSRGRQTSVKQHIMDGQVVVGVGNIYASEALFRAGIHPKRKAHTLSKQKYSRLAEQIRFTLSQAIEGGGSSIKDFKAIDGSSGNFQNFHQVYGREQESCVKCTTLIRAIRISGRSTFFCTNCQK